LLIRFDSFCPNCTGESAYWQGEEASNNWQRATIFVRATAPWSTTRIETPDTAGELVGISCPSTQLCVAVSRFGSVYTAIAPLGGTASWTSTSVGGFPTGISCGSSTLCVISGTTGVITSSNPTGGSTAWHATSLGSAPGLEAVSCAPEGLCVAVAQKHVYASNNPTAGSTAWTSTEIGDELVAVSCPTSAFCVVGDEDGSGGAYYTTNPGAATPTWLAAGTAFDGESIDSISCSSPSGCVAVGSNGDVECSSNLSQGWAGGKVDPSHLMRAIACPSTGLCAAIDENGAGGTKIEPGACVEAHYRAACSALRIKRSIKLIVWTPR
jgi:hypothetical protein